MTRAAILNLLTDTRRMIASAERRLATIESAELLFQFEIWLDELRLDARRLSARLREAA